MNRAEDNRKPYNKVKRNNNKKRQIDVTFDDVELLRIQGLIRCKSCKTPCPIIEVICPTCGANA